MNQQTLNHRTEQLRSVDFSCETNAKRHRNFIKIESGPNLHTTAGLQFEFDANIDANIGERLSTSFISKKSRVRWDHESRVAVKLR